MPVAGLVQEMLICVVVGGIDKRHILSLIVVFIVSMFALSFYSVLLLFVFLFLFHYVGTQREEKRMFFNADDVSTSHLSVWSL